MSRRSILTLAGTGFLLATLVACSRPATHTAAVPEGVAPAHATATQRPASQTMARIRPMPRPNHKVARANTQFPVYLTGYSYWSNTPPASAAIARPITHSQAGGAGTYDDPVTIAVGHSIHGSSQTLDYTAGTRFYFAKLRKYAIVEDVCGDGPDPQDEACHIGHNGYPWLDIYVDGHKAGESAADSCAVKITSVQPAIINPPSDLPAMAGPLTESGCQTFDRGLPSELQQLASAR